MARLGSVSHARVVLLPLLLLGQVACVNPEPSGAEKRSVEPSVDATASRKPYPNSPLGDVVDDYHGTRVADPYRWLEEPDSAETRAWVAAQNELTEEWLQRVPSRAAIRARLESLWNYKRYSMPRMQGGRYFFLRNDGLQEQDPLYVAESAAGEGRLLLDPQTFSKDGTVSLAQFVPSPDGKVLAYGTSDGGSDWVRWRFKDVDTGEHLPDVITRNKFGGLDWTAGGEGVVYGRFREPSEGAALHESNAANEVCLHRMGTPESEDIVLREASPQGNFLWPAMSEGRTAIVVHERDSKTRKNRIEVISLSGSSRGRSVELVGGFDADHSYVGNQGDVFWIQTELGAPNRRVVAIDLFSPERENWREIIAERDVALEACSAAGGLIFPIYLRDAHSEVRVHRPDGTLVRTQKLPGTGSVSGFRGERGDSKTWFIYTDFSTPAEVWELDVKSGKTQLLRRPEVAFDSSGYETEQVFYTSKDGTRVPMFLVHRRGLVRSGDHPTYLYGYGGFNASLTPHYRTSHAVWLERGGVLAIPNLRGGGEYGEDWHAAGTKLKKQNVFDDFIAAAEWLIENRYTSPEHLAIAGGSNGGLLVGACMVQRPELFAVALPAVGVMDMLRYQHFTIGRAWAGDYGTSEDPEEFRALYAYSPLHNLKDGESYPATLVTTGDHDDRVVPAHSYKFAARLQAAHAGNDPVLIRIETRAGHGAGKSTSMMIDEAADVLTFTSFFLGAD